MALPEHGFDDVPPAAAASRVGRAGPPEVPPDLGQDSCRPGGPVDAATRRRLVARLRDSSPDATRVAEQVRALGHPIRLRIVALLSEGDEYVGKIADRLGVRQTIVSQQLRVLRMQGLVAARWDNGCAYYRLEQPCLHELLGCLVGLREER